MLQTVAPVEDVVVVEDASDDEEAVSQMTIEDPIFLITIEDNPMHSMTEVKEEVITIGDGPLHSTTEVNEDRGSINYCSIFFEGNSYGGERSDMYSYTPTFTIGYNCKMPTQVL